MNRIVSLIINIISEESVEVGEGVFLYLGFSEKEEDLVRPYTKKGIDDIVPKIQKLIRETAKSLNAVSLFLLLLNYFHLLINYINNCFQFSEEA